MLNNRPDCICIYAKIMMNEDIAHPDNIRPWHIGVPRLKLIWQRTAGFTDNRYMMNNPGLDKPSVSNASFPSSAYFSWSPECPAGVLFPSS